MTPEQVKVIVNNKIALLKDSQTSYVRKKDDDKRKKLPHYTPIYAESVYLKDRIEVHTDITKIPDELLRKKAPFEDPLQFKWRCENFQPVTMPYFAKGISALNRIFNSSNYSVEFGSEEQEEFFEDQIPLFESIESYFQQIILTEKIVDPNAILAVKPYFLPIKEEIVMDEKGEEVINFVYDDSQLITPMPTVYGCQQVVDYVDGEYCILISAEKSLVKDGNKMSQSGIIFEIFDKTTIYRVEQIGKKNDWTFSDPTIYYEHNIGKLPCQKLKGIPKAKEMAILYYSYFIPAIPNLDLALYGMSNLDMSITSHMYPQKVEYVDQCENELCNNGQIRNYHENGEPYYTPCPDCVGSSGRIPNGPMNVKTIKMPNSMDNGTSIQNIPFPHIAYVDPPQGSLEFIHKKFKQDIIDAFAFMNIDVSNESVKGNENTALGKQIDREELFAFIMRISDEIFDLMGFTIDMMGIMRYGSAWEGCEINEPKTFAVRTEQDLTAEIAEAKKSGVPDVALREITKQYLEVRFGAENSVKYLTKIIEYTDRLMYLSSLEISNRLASGTVAKWEVILHDSIFTFIKNELLVNPTFLEQENDVIKARLIEIAKETESQISPVNTTDAILKMAGV